MAGVAAGLDELQSGLLETLGARYTLSYVSNLTDHPLDGSECIATRTNCLGDNHDTNYVVSSSLSLEDDDLFIFLGTDSVQTHKCALCLTGCDHSLTALAAAKPHALHVRRPFGVSAAQCGTSSRSASCAGTYTNIGVYHVVNGSKNSIKSTDVSIDDRRFDSSALTFAPKMERTTAALLFAFGFARNCSQHAAVPSKFCSSIPTTEVLSATLLGLRSRVRLSRAERRLLSCFIFAFASTG